MDFNENKNKKGTNILSVDVHNVYTGYAIFEKFTEKHVVFIFTHVTLKTHMPEQHMKISNLFYAFHSELKHSLSF